MSDELNPETLDDFVRQVWVTTSIEPYREVITRGWCEQLSSLTQKRNFIDEIAFDLILDWRAAELTAKMPVSMLDSIRAYHNAFVKNGSVTTSLIRLSELVPQALAKNLPPVLLNRTDSRELQKALVRIGKKVGRDRKNVDVELSLEDMWQQHLKSPGFQMSLWGSQRVSYVATYNAYDNFVYRMVTAALPHEQCRTIEKRFPLQFEKAFGSELCDSCWRSEQVHIARLVRNSLSHSGGLVSGKLAEKDHGFETRQNRIHVVPEKLKELFLLLESAVYAIAEKAVTLPQFTSN